MIKKKGSESTWSDIFILVPFSVSRHVKIFDVSYDVPDTPGVPRVLSPSFFRVSFHLHHSGHTLELTRNTGIRPQTVGCVHPTGRCQSTDVQVTIHQLHGIFYNLGWYIAMLLCWSFVKSRHGWELIQIVEFTKWPTVVTVTVGDGKIKISPHLMTPKVLLRTKIHKLTDIQFVI